MQKPFLFTVCLALGLWATLAWAQLILDEDDPAMRPLIHDIMVKINEHEHGNYTFKNVVYTLGEGPTFNCLLNVWREDHRTIVSCTVQLVTVSKDHYRAGNVLSCNH